MKIVATALALIFVAAIYAQAPAPVAADISNATIQTLMERRSGDEIVRMTVTDAPSSAYRHAG